MGGSLVKTGGHNPLEATVFGVPVVSGPHMFNFEDIATELSAAELLYVCDDEFEITKKINSVLSENTSSGTEKVNYSNRAKTLMQQHRGVTARLLNIVTNLIV